MKCLVFFASRWLVCVFVCLFVSCFASFAAAQQGAPRPSPIEELSQKISDLEASLNTRIDALRDQIEFEFDKIDDTLDVMGNAAKLNSSFCVDLNVFGTGAGTGKLEGGAKWPIGVLGKASLEGNLAVGGGLGGAAVVCIDVPIVALENKSVLNAHAMHQSVHGLPKEVRRQQLLAQTKSIESDVASIAAFMENVGTSMTGQMESVLFGEMQDFFLNGTFRVADVLADPSDLIVDMEELIFWGGGLGAINTRFGFVPFKFDEMMASVRLFLQGADPCSLSQLNVVLDRIPGFQDLVCANNGESLVEVFGQLVDAVDTIETQVDSIGGAVTGSNEDLLTAIDGLGSQITTVGSKVDGAASQITGAVNTGFGAITPTLNTLDSKFTDFQGRLDLMTLLVDGLFGKIITNDAFGRVENLVQTNLELINRFTSSQLSALQNVMLGEFGFIKPIIETIEDVVNKIENIVDDFP